ncbi:TPA: transcriptional regulator [Candidatus Acetothermia bacterium]|nr:transcriptional regulator [Candidatus Acetothermia bacterium]
MVDLAAVWRDLVARILNHARREPTLLLPFDWVKKRVGIKAWRYRGLQEVEVEQIVGSVNRYQDFDRAFFPLRGASPRLRQIEDAWRKGEVLPPVNLYKIGDAYFVEDGHHRVAAARRSGARSIDAEVMEFVPAVPISAADTPTDILIKAEYAAFLAQTHLDRVRPEQNILFTELGKYKILLDHIAVHRYFLGIEQHRDPPYEEAVASWYDRVYLPLVDTFRHTGALPHFPGRTEADLYVWVSEHLYYLRESHGPDLELDRAVEDYAQRFGIPLRPGLRSGREQE